MKDEPRQADGSWYSQNIFVTTGQAPAATKTNPGSAEKKSKNYNNQTKPDD